MKLIQTHHPKTEEIKSTLGLMNTQWEELCKKTADKDKKIGQAIALHEYNRLVN